MGNDANALTPQSAEAEFGGHNMFGRFDLYGGWSREAFRHGDIHEMQALEQFTMPRSISGGPALRLENLGLYTTPATQLMFRAFAGTHPKDKKDPLSQYDGVLGFGVDFSNRGLSYQERADVQSLYVGELEDFPGPKQNESDRDAAKRLIDLNRRENESEKDFDKRMSESPLRRGNESPREYAARFPEKFKEFCEKYPGLKPVEVTDNDDDVKKEAYNVQVETQIEKFEDSMLKEWRNKVVKEYGEKKPSDHTFNAWADGRYYPANRAADSDKETGTTMGQAGLRGENGSIAHVAAGAQYTTNGYKIRFVGSYGLGLDHINRKDYPQLAPYSNYHGLRLTVDAQANNLLSGYLNSHFMFSYTNKKWGEEQAVAAQAPKPVVKDGVVVPGDPDAAAAVKYNAGYTATTFGLMLHGPLLGKERSLNWKLHGLLQWRRDNSTQFKLDPATGPDRQYVVSSTPGTAVLGAVRGGIEWAPFKDAWMGFYGGVATLNDAGIGQLQLGSNTGDAFKKGGRLVPVLNTSVGFNF